MFYSSLTLKGSFLPYLPNKLENVNKGRESHFYNFDLS